MALKTRKLRKKKSMAINFPKQVKDKKVQDVYKIGEILGEGAFSVVKYASQLSFMLFHTPQSWGGKRRGRRLVGNQNCKQEKHQRETNVWWNRRNGRSPILLFVKKKISNTRPRATFFLRFANNAEKSSRTLQFFLLFFTKRRKKKLTTDSSRRNWIIQTW